MKHSLLLSLFLMLPIHAMKTENPKNDPHTQLLAEASEHHVAKRQSSIRNKLIATGLISLLAGAGVAANTINAHNAFEYTDSQILPYTPVLPANNATCTYQERDTTIWDDQCFIARTAIPAEYCDCEQPSCKIILQECQEKDPFKQQVLNTSVTALVAQIGAWLVGILAILHIN